MGFFTSISDAIHTGLDVVGMVPAIGEVADLANAGIYALEGDALNAGISLAACLPVGGQLATGARLAAKAGKEVLEAAAEKAAKEGAEKLGKEVLEEGAEKTAKEATGEAGEVAAKTDGIKVTESPPAKPLGRGSTGRTDPKNLKEKLAMEDAMSNPDRGKIVPLKKGMTDPRWPGDEGWVKMSQHINGVEVHYVRNANTGMIDDFKFPN